MTYFTAKDEITNLPPRLNFRWLALEAVLMVSIVGAVVKLI